ncbi:MAG: T9SS type A sorting domain-containing protein, partial [FCB group bacterium]|nr:T9SS type A sorting domain-containing protein [FCB group bacterium]
DSNIDASQGSYQWIVPKELSAKCKIMIEKAQDTYISAQSDLFKIKWYILTRFDSNNEYEAFDVFQDGWSFANDSPDMWPDTMWQNYDYTGEDPYTHLPYPSAFAGSPQSAFPDWPLFVEAFNINNCYYALPPNSNNLVFYRLWAVKKWKSIKGKWRGSCFGLANSSMLAFIDKPFFETLDGIGSFDNLMNFQINSDVRAVINKYQIYAYGRQFTQLIREQPVPSGIHTFKDCRQMLAADSALQNDKVLLFWWWRGGHAVTPYECRQDTGTIWRIYVFDNNRPGDSAKYVEVDTATNVWYYAPLNVGFYNGDMQLSDPLFDFYGDAQPVYDNGTTPNHNTYSMNSLNDVSGFTEFYITSIDSISFTSPLGTIGHYGDSSFNNLTLGQPIIPIVGQQVEPLGYILPDSSWTCQFSGFKDSVVPLRIFTDSTVMTYFNEHPSGSEKFYYPGNDSSLWIFNTGSDTNTITFEGDAIHPDSEIVTRISDFKILSGDSTGFSITDRSGLKIENRSQTTSYDIDLFYVGNTVNYIFHNEGVNIPGGAVHIITPTINDLDSNKLKILIDNNDDGIVDDSLFVVNIPTGVNGNNYTSLPKKYGLSQNYPNPFNATTTIRYELPQKSKVLITIYNIMGQKVATLVNKNEEAGVYTVNWNASNVASGIYCYRIEAGNFVQTKKMLLLK